ncbi:hypothetical protein PMAYCL1PPCAC_21778, partial [Pristionchus mayeri]
MKRLHANLIIVRQTSDYTLVERDHHISSEVQANCLDEENANNLSCWGDFCYYQNESFAVSRGCYTVDDTLAERKITVGFYENFNLYAYVCNTKFCNEDEISAKANMSPN